MLNKVAKGNECIICTLDERDCLIFPCRHNIACTKCSKNLKNCPVCRGPIAELIKFYKS